jgi:hypothetical protein
MKDYVATIYFIPYLSRIRSKKLRNIFSLFVKIRSAVRNASVFLNFNEIRTAEMNSEIGIYKILLRE